MSFRAKIIGTGRGFPENIMTNADFEAFLDTSDEWIRTRTGIETRRISDRSKNETTFSLCEIAARSALKKAGIEGATLDAIIVGTITPDKLMPTTANSLQDALGATRAFSFDLQAACSGFLYGLSIADHFIKAGTIQRALVIGAETLSTIMNWRDRTTCVLFGDGAGAVILERTTEKKGILACELYADGREQCLLDLPHGQGGTPPWSREYRLNQQLVQMQGAEIFKLAVRSMVDSSESVMKSLGLGVADIDFFIFHQANKRILEMCIRSLGIDPKLTWVNLQKYGNTSAATLPVALDEALEARAIKPGDKVLLSTFGGGLTWGSAVIQV